MDAAQQTGGGPWPAPGRVAAASAGRIVEPGRNCWRRSPVYRAAVLVDAENYYRAFRSAVLKARRSIHIAAWDIHTRAPLLKAPAADSWPIELGRFLEAVLADRPGLTCNILLWDVPLFYATDRELMPTMKFGRRGRCRVHLDSALPIEAAQHQKVVVIDDRLAFSGGLDITQARWDSRAHLPHEPRRALVNGRTYPPFHDVQMLVDGPAAADLGDLFRERWLRATGEALPRVPIAGHDPWPQGLRPTFRDTFVAIARTVAPYDGWPGAREIEQLILDAFAAAERWIYIEDQYLTSIVATEALASRLAQRSGPEVVVLLPHDWTGWLEARTMGEGRAQAIRQLRQADAWGRLTILYPCVGEGVDVKVHSKLTIIDDRLLRVGSANLANRSMGLDSECDLVVEADGDEAVRLGIEGVLHDLLAEHLGVAPHTVARTIAESGGSLVGTIKALGEALGGGLRGLRSLDPPSLPIAGDGVIEESLFVDPIGPFSAERLINKLMPGARAPDPRRVALKVGAGVLLVLLLALMWNLLPPADWLEPRRVLAELDGVRGQPVAAALTIGAFVVGGLTMVPVMGLISVTALVFTPTFAFAYAIVGSLLSAAAGYGVGYLLGRRIVARLAGRRVNRVGRLIRRHGVTTVFLLRIAPVAPFTIINVASGAARIQFRDYAVGTVLGMLPGITAITVLGEWLRRSLASGDIWEWVVLGGLGVALVAAATLTHSFIAKRRVQRNG